MYLITNTSYKINMKRNKWILMITTMIFVCGMVFAVNSYKSSASSVGYFSTYKDITSIQTSAPYTSAQGMSIYGNKAYYIKTVNTSDHKSASSQVWVYNLDTGAKKQVYNTDNKSYSFKIGHANSLYVDSKYMYIATQLKNEPSIYRLNVSCDNGKCYMGNLKKYKVYSSKTGDRKLMTVTGIEYANWMKGFLIKNGMKVYYGNFQGDEFVWTKSYDLHTNLTTTTKSGNEYIDFGNGKFIMQGMYYSKGILYLPMTNANKMGQSIVVAYSLDSSVKSGAILYPLTSRFFRITSKMYKDLFEIEEVAYYGGRMYANVNAVDNSGKGSDRIIRFNDFNY